MATNSVDVANWVDAVAALPSRPEYLTAVDDAGQVVLWLITESGQVLTCQLDNAVAPTLTSVWPAATIFEAALRRDFGISFGDTPVLVGELRKEVRSKARHDVPWPGAKDPSDDAAAPSRRRALPIGVREDKAGEFR